MEQKIIAYSKKRLSQWQKNKLWNHTYLYCGCATIYVILGKILFSLSLNVFKWKSVVGLSNVIFSFLFDSRCIVCLHFLTSLVWIIVANELWGKCSLTFWLSWIFSGFSLLGERKGEQSGSCFFHRQKPVQFQGRNLRDNWL